MRAIFAGAMSAAMAALEMRGNPIMMPNRIGPGIRSQRTGRVTANLSRRHPDYGLSPAEHFKRKAERAAGTRPFKEMGR